MICNIQTYTKLDNSKFYIYKITSPTNKIYIGQTTNIHRRFKAYKHVTCKGQIHLYNSLLKYGVLNHKFEIIQEFQNDIDLNVLNNYEVYYITTLKEGGIELLNIREGGFNSKISESTKQKMSISRKGKYKGDKNPMYGKTYSEEVKKIISDKNKGAKISEFNRKQLNKSVCKVILQYDLEGNFIKEWKSATNVQKELGFNSRVINSQARGIRKSAYSYIWKYKTI